MFYQKSIAQTCSNGSYQFSDMVSLFEEAGCLGCHGSQGGLDLSDYTNTVEGGNRGKGGCGSYTTALNFLIAKVDGSLSSSEPCGQPMPLGHDFGEVGMSAEAIDAIQSWIADGSPEFCPSCPPTGTACDDNDPCTVNDLEDGNCNCTGTFEDKDADGICDANDSCDGSLNGSACDDEDDCTTADMFDENCNCKGEPIINCGNTIDSLLGVVHTASNSSIQDITIKVGETEINSVDGTFSLAGISFEEELTITPSKLDQVLEGVTTFDMVLIRRHILGITALDSPYKLIAADVNQSNSISTFDMVLIQQIILGVITTFPNTPSYRFIPADFIFSDAEQPFQFPEFITLQREDIVGYLPTINFLAIKIGDVSYQTELPMSKNEHNSNLSTPTLKSLYIAFPSTPDPSINVYPNPAKEHIIIESFDPIQQILIFDASGKIVTHHKYMAASSTTTSLFVAKLERGMYWVNILGRDYTVTRKILLQ